MRRFGFAMLWLILLLASCADPEPVPAPTAFPPPVETARPPAPEIRFGLIGTPTDVNVWALFDEQGAGYANYALRADYWPRLYSLAPPDFIFQPRAASGQPAPVMSEGEFFTSTVTLRSDLKWTDGSPFTAEDVAFTINAALQFEPGFDWKAWYSTDYLARAEALDPTTVKFYFKQKPNVGVWQYGALQAPILQQAYWKSKIAEAATLLPDDALRASIVDARTRIAELTPIVEDLNNQVSIIKHSGKSNRELEMELKRNQGDLNQANNNLAKALAEVDSRIQNAHQALYAIDDKGEPTLGVWMPSEKQNGAWVNAANPDFPFEKPNFEWAVYRSYQNEKDALQALSNGDVDLILAPDGVSIESAALYSSMTIVRNQKSSARFLVFNPARAELAEPALRAALNCMIDRVNLSEQILKNQVMPLDAFVLPGPWRNPDVGDPCAGMDASARLQTAVDKLKAAGYTWQKEPTASESGVGILLPEGAAFPPVTLLAPLVEDDPLRAAAAGYIEERAAQLGIPLTKKLARAEDVLYAVYSAKKFDAALLGWRLSLYPAYLCEWLGGQSPFFYNGTSPALSGAEGLKSACEALHSESDDEAARTSIFEIQSALASDLPFIPLFSMVTYDAYRNLKYPFAGGLNGVSSLYGAPTFAIPSP